MIISLNAKLNSIKCINKIINFNLLFKLSNLNNHFMVLIGILKTVNLQKIYPSDDENYCSEFKIH